MAEAPGPTDKCGVCGSMNIDSSASIAVVPGDSYYGLECMDCGAYLDHNSGKTEWELGPRSKKKN
jgi:hypothetical protein